MKDSKYEVVNTRFAPSPTGQLHVGGARTALFNYLFAKKHDGKFILRIEDTDDERNIQNSHLSIEKDLKSINLFPDESFSIPGSNGPYLQSQKLDRYRELCDDLIAKNKAYRCFCTKEELQHAKKIAEKNNVTPIYSKKCRFLSQEQIDAYLSKNKPYVVRLKMDIKDKYEWIDLVRGKTTYLSASLYDHVIMRSNNKPTYNFAVVVDDFDMQITHVFRGEEHISNTPHQIATYHALGFESKIPQFGHLSIIVGKDRKKLSKRSRSEFHFISGLIEKGYVPDAIVNFLTLIGWSCGDKEFFTMSELIKEFNCEGLSKAPALFDIDKLNWINHKYLQDMNDDFYLNYLIPIFTVDLGIYNDRKKVFALVNKKNIQYGYQLNEIAKKFYSPKKLSADQIDFLKQHKDLLIQAKENFPIEGKNEWDSTSIRNYLKQLSQISGKRGKEFYKPLRIAFSMEDEGFELCNVIECLGRELALSNLEESLKAIYE